MFKIMLWDDEMLIEVIKAKFKNVETIVNNIIADYKLSAAINEIGHNQPDIDYIHIKGSASDLYKILVELTYTCDAFTVS